MNNSLDVLDKQSSNILLIEDNPVDADYMRILLFEESGIDSVQIAPRLETALKLIKQNAYELIILDLDLPDSFGMETLLIVLKQCISIPVVVVTGIDSEEKGIESVHYGAQDYLVKGLFERQHLARILKHSVERQKLVNTYYYASLHDPLTSLANRSLFMEYFQQAIVQNKTQPEHIFAVLFLDVDCFKWINDNYGHHIGDQVLVSVALRLKRVLRVGDQAARMGGDEFALIIYELSEPIEILPVLHRISKVLSEPYHIGQHIFDLSCSIGATLSTEQCHQPEEMLQHADLAMYQAKYASKGSYVIFNQQMLLQEQSQQRFEGALLEAYADDFRLYYQPIISLPTGRPFGLEAKICWENDDWKHLSDSEFEHKLDCLDIQSKLDQYMLYSLGKDLVRWQKRFGESWALNLFLSLPCQSLLSGRLEQSLMILLEPLDLNPANIYFRLKEDLLFSRREVDTYVPYLKSLGRKGFQFYLESSGNHLPSLDVLQHLPLDLIKIKLGNSKERNYQAAIPRLKTILELSNNIGLQVIVSNVQNDEGFRLLKKLNCSFIQGNYFSEPLLASEVSSLFV